MNERFRIDPESLRLLEEKGGEVAAQAKLALLSDPSLKGLKNPLKFLSRNWRDPLTPALMQLSCEAVGGSPEKTSSAALAISLMHQSFYIWDDIIDNSSSKMFKPTLFGKFGSNTALIIGGLSSAKAFSILNQMEISKEKRVTISQMCWNLWASIAQAEIASLRKKRHEALSCKDKFSKIKKEAVDLETCAKIGAVIGDASAEEIEHLGKYGLCLGIILELWKDFHVATNLTLGLAEKMRNGALPYSTLWASLHSEKLRKALENLKTEGSNEQSFITQIVEETLTTRVLDNIANQMKKYADKAQRELAYLNPNTATQTLKSFVGSQLKLFLESLK